jgi:rfaE bifunctional protein nucleotidyltransferase chain/domain
VVTVRSPESKLMTLDQAAAWKRTLHQRGRRLAVTNGCFDLLHRGHAEYLARARECADALLVAVNSDASVKALKGPSRPVVAEGDRAFLLASLEAVDAVVVFGSPKPLDVFRRVVPDVYVKGGDYTVDTIDREECALLQGLGCEFRFIPFVPGFSTTGTISRVREQA